MTKKRSNYQFYDHNVAAVPEASDLVALTGQLPWATHKCVLHRVLGRLRIRRINLKAAFSVSLVFLKEKK